jgi:hypothetical protein
MKSLIGGCWQEAACFFFKCCAKKNHLTVVMEIQNTVLQMQLEYSITAT